MPRNLPPLSPVRVTAFARTIVSLAFSTAIVACSSDAPTEPEPSSYTLEAVTPVELSATVQTEVTSAPTVRVRDRRGNPVNGVRVLFLIIDGDRVQAITDANGTATMGTWKLGPSSGTYTVRASVAQNARLVDFHALATPDAPASIKRTEADMPGGIVAFPGDSYSFDVRVTDRFGNGISDVPVSFRVLEGDGSINNARERTDFHGMIHVRWTFGSVGENSIEASVVGVDRFRLNARVEELPDASVGFFELDNIQVGNFTLQPFRSWIALGANGRFTVFVNGVVGHGEYVLNSKTIDFKYSDAFLPALGAVTDYYPSYPTSASAERGYLDSNALILYRCWSEDCYDATWNYRRSPKP